MKLGGDKGGGTFKMSFQIVNVPTPNSVHNTCVFCCFAADDSVCKVHLIATGDQVKELQGMKLQCIITCIVNTAHTGSIL